MISFKGEFTYTELTLSPISNPPLAHENMSSSYLGSMASCHPSDPATTKETCLQNTIQGLWLVWLGNSDVPGLIVCVSSSELWTRIIYTLKLG